MSKVRWGVLSTSNLALAKVIPAMQAGQYSEVVAIASRSLEKARAAAKQLNIPTAYGSYEDLLNDPDIDAIYNPLPNHLHVPLSIQALKAGKHVLCEKPISMTSAEAQELLDAAKQYPHLKVMEAFMYRFHPQWQRTLQLVKEGAIGELLTIQSFFSYIFGTEGHIEIEIPVNAPPDKPCRLWLTRRGETEEVVFDVCNQYTIQGDLFSQAVLNNTDVPTPLEDAVHNMQAIEAIFESAKTGTWV